MILLGCTGLFLASLLLLFPASRCQAEERHRLEKASQLIVVLSASWEDTAAKLYLFDKKGDDWHRTAGPYEAVVGKKGMGVGLGNEKEFGADIPIKREGDGKAPAGVLDIKYLMGYADKPPEGATYPYKQIKTATHCVDDPASSYYNQIVETGELPSAHDTLYKSHEDMLRKDDLYKWLIVLDYNPQPSTPKAGSCIFIHIWRSAKKGTAGCTAISEDKLLSIMGWLKQEANPAVLLMPSAAYSDLVEKYSLPALR